MGPSARAESVSRALCEKLGLGIEPASSQVTHRDRHAEFLQAIALTGASLERFATEIRHLQRSEVGEAQEAFRAGRHLLVEAGTGVGKSFAYLLPGIEAAGSGHRPAVISTHTISLQEQLIGKDIPFLQCSYLLPLTWKNSGQVKQLV